MLCVDGCVNVRLCLCSVVLMVVVLMCVVLMFVVFMFGCVDVRLC